MGRNRVSVVGDELRVNEAHLPIDLITAGISMDAGTLRRLVGRHGDPSAFVAIRAWIGPGVQLIIDDPDDPTPYWVVSTRHPDRFVEVVRGTAAAAD
jgi:hypothetical protein